jgi:enamine deaminase RidA (YjgF/YER057c/UK114 family)
MTPFTNELPAIYLTTIKSALDLMNTWLGGFERMQTYQTRAIEEVRASHGEAAKELGSAHTLPEVQAVHAELARSQMARLQSYWSGMYAAGCQSHVELLKEAQAKAREVADEIDQKLEAATPGAVPVLSALKLMMGAAHSTYAATARTTEEMVRLSAAQINAANASAAARQGNGKGARRAA